jgi:ribonuclease P protein component
VPGESNLAAKTRAAKAAFPRSLRLLRHADFERVYKAGRRHFSTTLTVFFLGRGGESGSQREPETKVAPGLRVGFTVGRALGNAVQRNRMKRRLREAVRLSDPPVSLCADVVINPKKTLLRVDFEQVRGEIRRAFAAIEQKLGTAAADK